MIVGMGSWGKEERSRVGVVDGDGDADADAGVSRFKVESWKGGNWNWNCGKDVCGFLLTLGVGSARKLGKW